MSLAVNPRRLFLILFLVGLANIFLAYVFFYFSSVTLLEERSGQQMASVGAQASHKLTIYLETLKSFSRQSDEKKSDHYGVTGLFREDPSGKISKLRGPRESLDPVSVQGLEPMSFYPLESEEIVIKVPEGKGFLIWVYSGFYKLLQEREGLGETGEIYLVGPDQRIRSASRHLKDWKGTRVLNKSVTFGAANKSGVHQVKDYRGIEVVSAYEPFDYDHLDFVLLSEIDKDEVLQPLKDLFPKILSLCIAFCCLTLVFAYISTLRIMKLIDRMRTQINNFHIRMIHTMEEEKKRMSVNLHDGVGQILTAIKWGISQNEKPEKLKELCDDAFKEIRSISNNLMPAVLTEFGFFSAIQEYMTKIGTYYKITATYRFSEQLSRRKFKEGMDVNLYRMIQELLHNTLKHASATSVSLILLKEEDFLQLRYEDDGIGMEDAAPMPKALLYRTELMGAVIKRKKIEPGLVFEVQIPLEGLFL